MDERFENEVAVNDAENSRGEPYSVCAKCKASMSSGQNFCHNCGSAAKKNVVSAPFVRKDKKNFILSLIKSSLILAMALFMIVAAFLPMVRYEVEIEVENDDDIEPTVHYGAIDSMKMFANSLLSLDEEDVEELRSDIWKDVEEYESDWEEGDELDKLASFIKEYTNVMLRSEDVEPTIGIVTTMLLSLLQIVMAVVLLVFASLSFAAAFTDKIKNFHALSLVLMGLAAVVMLVNAVAFKFMIMNAVVYPFVLGPGISIGTEIAAMPICIVVFTLLLMAAFAILRVTVEKEKIAVGTLVKHAISLVFAFALIFSAFAPIVTTEVKTKFLREDTERRETSTLSASLFCEFDLNDAEKKELDDQYDEKTNKTIAQVSFAGFEQYTKRQFAKGEAEQINQLVYSCLFLDWGAYEISGAFAFGAIAMLLIVLCAALLIWQNAHELATGKRLSLFVSLPAKIVAILMAIIVMVLVIVMCGIVNKNADSLDLFYRTQTAYGSILMLIFSVITICIPPAEPKKAMGDVTKLFMNSMPSEE